MGQKPSLQSYTLDQIVTHTNESDCWIIVNKYVYDVIIFLDHRPGGKECLLKKAGTHCTEDLDFHSKSAKLKLKTISIDKLIYSNNHIKTK